ncbi:MAG: polyprenyl synthetase family protein, partial [Oscillospiraceae bacterium]|nr:polyprenyl synthetase family protein [Oscillospiraceae bacterium]
MEYAKAYEAYRAAVEEALQSLFLRNRPYRRLQEAMRYSLLAGGKRVRPVMVLAFCEALGGDPRLALPLGCALECVHTYSLIHDDLPCMDDDDLRRGRPTCHKVYGETMAVLAGDALQAEAFRLISLAPGLSAEQRIDAVNVLASACGGDGMVAGQVLDVEGLARDETSLRDLCLRKTGGLLGAAAVLGCVAA